MTSQQYTITATNDAQRCYVIAAQHGFGVEVTITDTNTSSGIRCGEVRVLFDPSMWFWIHYLPYVPVYSI